MQAPAPKDKKIEQKLIKAGRRVELKSDFSILLANLFNLAVDSNGFGLVVDYLALRDELGKKRAKEFKRYLKAIISEINILNKDKE